MTNLKLIAAGILKSRRLWTVLVVGFAIYAAYRIIQERRADSYFHLGLSRFVSGNLNQSIESLEQSYELAPDNDRTNKLLERVLVECAVDSFAGHEYEKSLAMLVRAQELNPSSQETAALIKNIREKLVSGQSAVDRSQNRLNPKIAAKLTPAEKIALARSAQWSTATMEGLNELDARLSDNTDHILYEIDMNAYRAQKSGIVAAILLAILIIAGLAAVLIYVPRESTRIIMAELELRRGNSWDAHDQASLPDLQPQSLLLYSGGKAQKIMAIEAELVADEDKEIAERLLEPFLKDPDPWIKAKAAMTLYRHNPKHAIDHLRELLSKKGEEIPAVLALGEIGTTDSIKVFTDSFNRFDSETQKAALQSILKLSISRPKDDEARRMVELFLNKIQSEGNWVV